MTYPGPDEHPSRSAWAPPGSTHNLPPSAGASPPHGAALYAPHGAVPYPPPHAMPHAMPAPHPVCQVCSGSPAASVVVRQHTGMIILAQWRSARGLFCRTCGTALLRKMTAHTLALGWWGLISLFIGTPFTLITNAGAGRALRRLPAPGPHGPQLDPGRPLLRRAGTYVPVVSVALIVVLAVTAVVTAP